MSEKLLDMPNRAASEEKRCGHDMPENMSTYLLAKVRPSGDRLEDVFHCVIGKTVGLVSSGDEKSLLVVATPRQVPLKPLERSLRKEEHPLFVPFPDSLCLASLKVDVSSVKCQYLGDLGPGSKQHLDQGPKPKPWKRHRFPAFARSNDRF